MKFYAGQKFIYKPTQTGSIWYNAIATIIRVDESRMLVDFDWHSVDRCSLGGSMSGLLTGYDAIELNQLENSLRQEVQMNRYRMNNGLDIKDDNVECRYIAGENYQRMKLLTKIQEERSLRKSVRTAKVFNFLLNLQAIMVRFI